VNCNWNESNKFLLAGNDTKIAIEATEAVAQKSVSDSVNRKTAVATEEDEQKSASAGIIRCETLTCK
jgi:hypothetical protein